MRLISFLCVGFFLTGCAQLNYFPSNVKRNQVYEGQTVADLYENFGAPKRVEQYNYGLMGHTFMKEEIIQEDGQKKLNYCDLRVLTRNNHVINWDWRGNNCQFEVADATEYETP